MEQLLFLPSNRRKSFFKKLLLVLIMVIIGRLWTESVVHFFNWLESWRPFDPGMGPEGTPDVAPPFLYITFYNCILTPFWEELTFRWFPIRVGRQLGQKFVFPFCVLSSILFAIAHQNGIQGFFLQGVAGMLCCIVYIKNKYSYISSFTVHSLFNFTFILWPTIW